MRKATPDQQPPQQPAVLQLGTSASPPELQPGAAAAAATPVASLSTAPMPAGLKKGEVHGGHTSKEPQRSLEREAEPNGSARSAARQDTRVVVRPAVGVAAASGRALPSGSKGLQSPSLGSASLVGEKPGSAAAGARQPRDADSNALAAEARAAEAPQAQELQKARAAVPKRGDVDSSTALISRQAASKAWQLPEAGGAVSRPGKAGSSTDISLSAGPVTSAGMQSYKSTTARAQLAKLYGIQQPGIDPEETGEAAVHYLLLFDKPAATPCRGGCTVALQLAPPAHANLHVFKSCVTRSCGSSLLLTVRLGVPGGGLAWAKPYLCGSRLRLQADRKCACLPCRELSGARGSPLPCGAAGGSQAAVEAGAPSSKGSQFSTHGACGSSQAAQRSWRPVESRDKAQGAHWRCHQ